MLRIRKIVILKGENPVKKRLSLRSLFGRFFLFGCFTFGGGWSIVAQIQRYYVDKEHLVTSAEVLDMTSVGRSLPGTMIANVAMLFGYHMAGIAGGCVCIIGLVLPPFLVLCVITCFYSMLQGNVWMIAAMQGVRSAVVPIILCSILRLMKDAFRYPPCLIVAAAAFLLYLLFHVSCILLVAGGIVCGIALSEYYERKAGRGR